MNTDPLDFLIDLAVGTNGTLMWRVEQPNQVCPCVETGWIANAWLLGRLDQCNCEASTQDFTYALHDVSCDSVPCPFCPLETP